MTAPVIFPDACDVVVAWLDDQLPDYGFTPRVGTRVPNPRPVNLVLVRRVGGPNLNLVADQAMLTVECWAGTDAAAHDLAQTCRALVHALRGTDQDGVAVYRITETSGPQDLPDPESQHPRYTFTVQVAMRGAALEPSS